MGLAGMLWGAGSAPLGGRHTDGAQACHVRGMKVEAKEHQWGPVRIDGGQGTSVVVLGKFGLVRFRAIFAGPETGRSGP